jgi:hypothetical protein
MSTRHGWHWLRLKMRGRICITGDVPVHIRATTLFCRRRQIGFNLGEFARFYRIYII